MGEKQTIKQDFLDFVFPVNCQICGQRHRLLCTRCLSSLERAHLKCLRCHKFNPNGQYCLKCANSNFPDRALSVFRYNSTIKELIHQFKFDDCFELAHPLADFMAKYLKTQGDFDDFVITFIPIHSTRRRYRGYNQSELLARRIALKLNRPCIELLVRQKKTESQIFSSSAGERRRNIRSSMKVSPAFEKPAKVLLVDDVITSGATIEEASKILKRAGTKKVVAISVALG